MAVAIETGPRATGGTRTLGGRQTRPSLAGITGRRRFIYLTVLNALAIAAALTLAEIAFRWLWNPKYWIHTRQLARWIGPDRGGQEMVAGHDLPGRQLRVSDRVPHQCAGISSQDRRRPGARPYRIAFVGDSFTEGMQVPYEATFCARLERLLNQSNSARPSCL